MPKRTETLGKVAPTRVRISFTKQEVRAALKAYAEARGVDVPAGNVDIVLTNQPGREFALLDFVAQS